MPPLVFMAIACWRVRVVPAGLATAASDAPPGRRDRWRAALLVGVLSPLMRWCCLPCNALELCGASARKVVDAVLAQLAGRALSGEALTAQRLVGWR